MHLRGRAGVSIGNQWDKLVKSRVKIRNTYRKFYTDSNQNVEEENKKLIVHIKKRKKSQIVTMVADFVFAIFCCCFAFA